MHPGTALEQLPAAYEHAANGAVGNGNKLGNGLRRVPRLALEGRASGRIPCAQPVFAWLAEHAGDVATNHLAGEGLTHVLGAALREAGT